MPSRTRTADLTTIALPDGRIYDFAQASSTPFTVAITADGTHDFKKSMWTGWTEEHRQVLKCTEGRVLVYKGFGLYSSVDSSFGASGHEDIEETVVYSWQRNPDCKSQDASRPREEDSLLLGGDIPMAGEEGDVDVQKQHQQHYQDHHHLKPDAIPTVHTEDDDKLLPTVELSLQDEYWNLKYGPQHELFHRNFASMHLDAQLYPSLPTTPVLIRWLLALPRFIFPSPLRDLLLRFFLWVQLLTLMYEFDYHPYMGKVHVSGWYQLLVKGIVLWPEQVPGWVARWEWNTMVVESHIKVWFWGVIGRRVLGMKGVYEEYSPGRLAVSRGVDEVSGKDETMLVEGDGKRCEV